ncbi:hypothetical protein OQA88_12878 [Cercophora sp. LCS_1]
MSASIKEELEAVAPVAEAQPMKQEVTATDNDKMEVNPTSKEPAVNTNEEVKSENATTNDQPGVKPEVKLENGVKRATKSNAKFDPSVLEKTDDPKKIRDQVEFYFGDVNLPTDKFLWSNTGGEENKPVSLKTICTFKRMTRFEPYSAVVAALKESKIVQITGADGEEMVSRKVAYKSDPNGPKKRFAQSVYIKGFGEETDTLQVDIEAWAAKYGEVDRIKLRREDDGKFKGSVFIEFHNPELAEKFVALDPAPKFQDKELVIMTKTAYTEMKLEQIRSGEIEPSKAKPNNFYEGKTGHRGRGGHHKGDRNKENGKHGRDNERNGFRGGRGGRGRGRGGRGRGGRGGRDGRSRDERANGRSAVPDKSVMPKSVNDVKEPEIKSTAGKRAREDDGGAPPAKKVDNKE